MSIWTNGFFARLRGNVIKWWRLTILPVFRLNNNNPANVAEEIKKSQNQSGHETKNPQEAQDIHDEQTSVSFKEAAKKKNLGKSEMDIIARLDRERREDEERKRKEIEVARQKAQEQERIAAVLNANKVNVDSFIEEGKASREKSENAKQADSDEDAVRRAEQMLRAQEIIDRLNREAAIDEAKKQAEIEAVRKQAEETFGQ